MPQPRGPRIAWAGHVVHDRVFDLRRHGQTHRYRAGHRAVRGTHGDRADDDVDVVGFDGPSAAGGIAGRRRDQHDLRGMLRTLVRVVRVRSQAEAHRCPTADFFERFLESSVSVQFGGEPPDVASRVPGPYENHGDRRVDDRHRELASVGQRAGFTRRAGRQNRATEGPAGVQIFQADARTRCRYAVEPVVAFDRGPPAAHRDVSDVPLARIRRQDADPRDRFDRGDHTFVNRKGADRGRHVAARAAPVDQRRAHVHLAERERHVMVGSARRTDDHDFAQGRDAATQAVDLAAIRVRTAQRGENDPLTDVRGVRCQDVFAETDGAAGPAAHEHGRDADLHGACPRLTPHGTRAGRPWRTGAAPLHRNRETSTR